MHGLGLGAVQAEREARRFSAGCGSHLMSGFGRCGYGLAGASNHGVNRVENDGEQHPEDGRQEKAAHHLAYGMGLEESG
jgi:hypothetical protein